MKKKCSACKQEKILDSFGLCNKSPDKLNYHCKECASLKRKEQYQKNKEKHIAYAREWQSKNPEKYKASQTRINKNRIQTLSESYIRLIGRSRGYTKAALNSPELLDFIRTEVLQKRKEKQSIC